MIKYSFRIIGTILHSRNSSLDCFLKSCSSRIICAALFVILVNFQVNIYYNPLKLNNSNLSGIIKQNSRFVIQVFLDSLSNAKDEFTFLLIWFMCQVQENVASTKTPRTFSHWLSLIWRPLIDISNISSYKVSVLNQYTWSLFLIHLKPFYFRNTSAKYLLILY